MQIRRHIASIRQSAAKRFPDIPFEKIALYVDMANWPVQVAVHPLECVPYEGNVPDLDTPIATHYRNMALHRVERGQKDVTMLTICCEDGLYESTRHFVVSIDKSAIAREKSDWRSTRASVIDEYEDPMDAEPDFVDEIIELVQKTAGEPNVNIWKDGLIDDCVNMYSTSKLPKIQ